MWGCYDGTAFPRKDLKEVMDIVIPNLWHYRTQSTDEHKKAGFLPGGMCLAWRGSIGPFSLGMYQVLPVFIRESGALIEVTQFPTCCLHSFYLARHQSTAHVAVVNEQRSQVLHLLHLFC